MNIAPIADVKTRFSAYVEKTRQGPVVVTKNGRAVAVILNVKDDDDLERILLANSPKLRKILDAAEQRIRATGGIPHEDIWKTIEAAEEV